MRTQRINGDYSCRPIALSVVQKAGRVERICIDRSIAPCTYTERIAGTYYSTRLFEPDFFSSIVSISENYSARGSHYLRFAAVSPLRIVLKASDIFASLSYNSEAVGKPDGRSGAIAERSWRGNAQWGCANDRQLYFSRTEKQ
jgi:hypothetical protein